jgi:hypothetical protein
MFVGFLADGPKIRYCEPTLTSALRLERTLRVLRTVNKMRVPWLVVAPLLPAFWGTEIKAQTSDAYIRELTEGSSLIFKGTIKGLKS